MQCHNSRLGRRLTVELSGQLDNSTAQAFEDHCRQSIAPDDQALMLDLSRLDYVSSAGLRSILTILKKVKPQGGKVIICGAKGTAKEIFDISGFSSMFPMVNTLEDAAKLVL